MQSYLHIVGGQQLTFDQTKLRLYGFKHAWVLTLCNTILFPEITFHFFNVPQITETNVLIAILRYLGADCILEKNEAIICTKNMTAKAIPTNLSEQIHGALYLLPVLLSRFGKAILGRSGGCAIGNHNALGARPYDHMISVLEQLGYHIACIDETLVGKKIATPSQDIIIDIHTFSEKQDQLTGPKVSGATKTALLAAAGLNSTYTVKILNPYLKPDVLELLRLLQLLSFELEWNDTEIKIRKKMTSPPATIHFTLLGDVSVLMTYITLAVLYKQALHIKDNHLDRLLAGLKAETHLLNQMGVKLILEKNTLNVIPPTHINAVNIDVLSTSIYSDHQPFFALMLTQASSPSQIKEYVWLNRFAYVKELKKLGFKFELDANQLIVFPSQATCLEASLEAHDLRAAAVLLLAACKNKGHFYLSGYEHLNRGYEDLISLLNDAGATIRETYAYQSVS